MKRFFSIFGIVLALLLAAGGGWYLFGGGADRDAAAQAATGASVAQGAAGEINASSDSGTVALDLPASLGAIVADAKVVPVQAATLSLPTGGVVAEVLVDAAGLKHGLRRRQGGDFLDVGVFLHCGAKLGIFFDWGGGSFGQSYEIPKAFFFTCKTC